jgi:hypothetical protein
VSALVRYEAARSALAEAQRVDEVKDIRDKAEAMAAYARQAKDSELIQYATEIKVRAERRCGELLARFAETGERATRNHGGANIPTVSNDTTPRATTLSEMGLTRDESSRYQQLAAMPEDHFETAVETAKATAGEVTSAFMLRAAKAANPKDKPKAAKPHAKPKTGAKADAVREELKQAAERGVSMIATYAGLTLRALLATDSVTDQERVVLGELAELIAAMTAKEAKP